MAVGPVRLHDHAVLRLLRGPAWDDLGGSFAFALITATYVPSLAHDLASEVGLGNFVTVGDGSPIVVPDRSYTSIAGVVRGIAGPADFGAEVTVPMVKYLMCLQGGVVLDGSEGVIFHVDLDDLGDEESGVSSFSSPFKVAAPPNGSWFRLIRGV